MLPVETSNLPRHQDDEDTILVAGVMRTGQTWLCFMFAHAFNARFVEPYCLLRGIVYSGHDYVRSLTLGKLPGRAATSCSVVVKTHEHPDQHYSLTRKLVLIVRDPRDTVTSAALRYHIINTTGSDVEEDAQSLSFVPATHGRPPSIKSRIARLIYRSRLLAIILTARKWTSFNEAWSRLPFCHVVRFEDLIRDPAGELARLTRDLGLPLPIEQLEETAQLLSMKEINRHHATGDPAKRIGFRKGVAGDFRNHLSRLEIAVIRRYCKRTATRFGYDL